jgi:DNA-binding NarL/FixJ family response regulator
MAADHSGEFRMQGAEGSELRIDTFVVIDMRTLSRECFMRAIETEGGGHTAIGFSSVADWRRGAGEADEVDVILYNIGSAHPSTQAVGGELRDLVAEAAPTPVIVIAESEELDVMFGAIECGARGYIPASIGIDMLFHATNLTSAGGIFLPTSAVRSLQTYIKTKGASVPHAVGPDLLTSRQAAVAEAIRQGKANKTIAYDLNMCENTVKVHVRNIMKKLKATNRTEAAFKLSAMVGNAVGSQH